MKAINNVTGLGDANEKTDVVEIRSERGNARNEFNLQISATWDGTITVLRKIENINNSQENKVAHTGADAAAALTAAALTGVVADELIGMWVLNETDDSMGPITDNTATVITATLAGGTDNEWNTGNEASIWEVVDTYTSNASNIGTEGTDLSYFRAIMSAYTSGTARVVFSQ
jgi:hypothetical protein